MVKEIIVVAPKGYISLARKLARVISRKDGCNGTLWPVEQYENNASAFSDSHFIMHVGNIRENKFTRRYLPAVTNLKNQTGACYGYAGSKAFVFGEGNFDHAAEIRELFVRFDKILPLLSVLLNNPVMNLFPFRLTGIKTNAFLKYNLRLLQTDAAAAFFLDECFDRWVCERVTIQG